MWSIQRVVAFISFLLFSSIRIFAQEPTNDLVVTGYAEAAYTPDYIILAISNHEVQKLASDENATAEKEGELLATLKQLGIDSTKLEVHRFSVGAFYALFMSSKKYTVYKTYSLRIDD